MQEIDIRISVVMATYNGQEFVENQIRSILPQLSSKDEIIISDNYSSDDTWNIICRIAMEDSRIKCVRCEHKGIIENFNNALSVCRGKYIFLCDQDDVWTMNKVSTIMDIFTSLQPMLIVHNCQFIDRQGLPIEGDLFVRRNARVGLLKNLFFNSYQGSCMAFDRKILDIVFPVPSGLSMHDQWIGLIAEKYGEVIFLDKSLLLYRRYDDAASNARVRFLPKMIKVVKLLYFMTIRTHKFRYNLRG